MFVFCLDSPLPGVNTQSSPTANDLSTASARALHGNGSANSSCNRWFDQTNQVVTVILYNCTHVLTIDCLEF